MGQSAILSTSDKFDFARKRVRQQRVKTEQAQTQKLKEVFAGGLGLGSGAFVKNMQLLQRRLDEQEGVANEQINLAEFDEETRKKEVKEEREFRSGEALKSREFAGEQAGIQRGFAGEQAGIQRQFAGEQAGLQREFGSVEAEKGRGFAGEQAGIQRAFASVEAQKQRTLQEDLQAANLELQKTSLEQDRFFKIQQMDLFQQQLELDKVNSEFNKQMSLMLAGKPTDLLGSLFGPAFSTSSGGGLSFVGDVVSAPFEILGGIF